MRRGVATLVGAGVLAASLAGFTVGSAPVAAADSDEGSSVSADRSQPRARDAHRAAQREQRRPARIEREEPEVRAAEADDESLAGETEPGTGTNFETNFETGIGTGVAEPVSEVRRAVTVNVEPDAPGPVAERPAATTDDEPAETAAAATDDEPAQPPAQPVGDAAAAVAATPPAADRAQAASLHARTEAAAATHTTAVTTLRTPPRAEPQRRATLVNVVGSMVLNLIGAVVRLIDGPPMVPANSTVTVRTSSLTLPIGKGRTVQADWYFPETVTDTTRLVYLQHGFLASAPMYSYTAAELAERTNSIVVAPTLSSNFFAPDAAWVGGSTMHRAMAELFAGERAALNESASAAAGYDVILPTEFVMVGHSAGGTMVTSTAGFMADNGAIDDLIGIVMLDGVEPAGSRLVSDALAKLTGEAHRPIYLISSQRYFWSRGGDMADKLSLARPHEFTGVGLEGGMHIDYMTGGNRLIKFAQYVVGGFSQPRNIHAAGLITAGWVNDLFSGTRVDGVYGEPHEVIPVETSAGTATAVVLPLGYPSRPVWPIWLDTVLTAVFEFLGEYVFVYEPLRGHEVGVGYPAATSASSSSTRGSDGAGLAVA
ncbi:alpha/beta hydrolase [Mycobacterium sp. pV006]|uniref:alpha/beta hydrolase n=1 Tax=Mycobacterium sp. pV006 TaxID=3238983 RepID=UPI00351ACCB1